MSAVLAVLSDPTVATTAIRWVRGDGAEGSADDEVEPDSTPTPYGADASGDGVYGLASSQPGIGPYAVGETRPSAGAADHGDGGLSASGEFRDPPGALDCANPWRCPEHSPFTGGD